MPLPTLTSVTNRVRRLMLSPVALAVLDDRLTYLTIEKLERIERALRATRGCPGDMVEFGVALGGSGIIMARGADPDRRYVGFDVFGMIPPPTSDLDDAKSRARYDVIRSGASNGIGGDPYYGYVDDLLGRVKSAFSRHGAPVDGESVILRQGLFQDTWAGAGVERIAFAHVDCDWHDPVAFCLDACADRVSPGGVVVIDDYHDYGGCRAAVDAFLKARPDFTMEDGVNPFLRKRG